MNKVIDPKFMDNPLLLAEFLKMQLKIKPDTVVEVGAFDAEFSRLISKIINCKNIWAFEANPHVYKNFYPIKDVNYINKAISDVNGSIKFELKTDEDFVVGNNSIMNRVEKRDIEYLDVESTTLDSMFGESKSICLWIDCEGASEKVFMGAKKIIKNVSSIFIEVEALQLWKDQWIDKDVDRYLLDNGFVLYARDNQYPPEQYNCIYVKKELI